MQHVILKIYIYNYLFGIVYLDKSIRLSDEFVDIISMRCKPSMKELNTTYILSTYNNNNN